MPTVDTFACVKQRLGVITLVYVLGDHEIDRQCSHLLTQDLECEGGSASCGHLLHLLLMPGLHYRLQGGRFFGTGSQ